MTVNGLTRRGFLNLVGRAGGATALYETMGAMGLLPVPAAYAGPPELRRGSGKGVRVAILGAGIAGMTAAHELAQAGYRCTILEARPRAGGRNWTLRHGDLVEETASHQRCSFSAGDEIYVNAGPARIPQQHQGILSYCRKFGVALEPMVNDNRNAFFQSDGAFGGKPIRARQFITESRGYIAELLAKAINQRALDEDVTAEDRERVLAMLRSFGTLSRDFQYKGSGRAGFSEWPGAGDAEGKLVAPLDRRELLRPPFAFFQQNWSELIDFAPTMLQPKGGMDQIARAFERAVRPMVRFRAEVREIRRHGEGVRIHYRDGRDGPLRVLAADYCICTIPLPVLAAIPADFSPAFRQAIAAPAYAKAVKIAFQAKRRFWEEDDQIYGGISWTGDDVTQIWYPSTGFQGKSGVLLGAYIWTSEIGERFGRMAPAERIAAALRSGAKLHAAYGESLAHGISVAWEKIPYNLGSWVEWEREQRADAYQTLNQPDGPIYLAGEHLSHVTAWQEGAVLSAHAVVAAIDARVRSRKI
ncbi:MAG TPA: flavin monoamine oxidase family protein [Stellaceae bacterium]|nr:flavin monoamine oxidase family protein [Stellaceae bacterium]